jgi:hypothetical protein
VGEVVSNQNPITVELPATAFSRQGGGNLYQAGHPQRMAAMFGADPDLQLLGEFTNFDAGTKRLIQSGKQPCANTCSWLHEAFHLKPSYPTPGMGDRGSQDHQQQ